MNDERRPLIHYPSVYAFKVMGTPEGDFAGYVRALFTELLGTEVADEAIESRTSSGGRFVSLTVSVRLESEAVRRAIYARLHQEDRIVYYL